jgi:hypothetical protein
VEKDAKSAWVKMLSEGVPNLPVLAGHIAVDRAVSNHFPEDFRQTVGALQRMK